MDIRRIDFAEAELFIRAEGDWRGFRSGACSKEPETTEWIRRGARSGAVFFDIGACVGSYSLIAAALGATVHAFEPVAVNYAQLQMNVWLNSLQQISTWPVALQDRNAPLAIELSSSEPGAASHSIQDIHSHEHADDAASQAAIGFSLDSFIKEFHLPQPDSIKIDVDGGEIAVLEGGRETLRSVESVMVEVNPLSEPSVAAILIAAGLEQTGSWPRSGRQSNHLFERVPR